MTDDLAARADSLLDVGRPHEAIALLQQGLATAPEDVGLLEVLARAQLQVAPADALATAGRLIALDPEDHVGHLYAALAHDELGNRKPAVEHARAAAAIAPDDVFVLGVLALTASRRSRGRKEALEAAHRATHIAPQDPAGYFAIGVVELHSGHWRRAAEYFEHVLELDPHHQAAQVNLAIAKEASGDLRAAFGGTDALLRFDPTDADARMVLDEVVYTTLVHLMWIALVLLVVVGAFRGF